MRWRYLSPLLALGGARAQQACEAGQCFPAVGDLLIGRGDRLVANSTCGLQGEEDYCIIATTDGQGSCFKCDSTRDWNEHDPSTWDSHRIQNIIMSRGVARDSGVPEPWWQSVNGENNVYIQLNLEAQFSFTHLIMTFKTFRPAAMVVKRSSDDGKTWKPYRYFAEDCEPFIRENPEIAPGPIPTRIDEVICDQSFNKKVPSHRGEIVLKVLEPQLHEQLGANPYTEEVMELLKVTNIRIEFLKLHTLGDDHIDSSMGTHDSNKKYYYGLYNLVVRGSCFCYGHASMCRPLDGDEHSAAIPGMVHGRCDCEHNTEGMNCEKCKPFYQDVPWQPAKEGDTNQCRPCNCHNHSNECHFDEAVWEATNHVSGGVCDNCQHNTEGIHCEYCREGFYHDESKDFTDPDMCIPCDCDPDGTINGGICDRETHPDKGLKAGKCHCKANVTGERCDQCKAGYHSLSADNFEGCSKCECDAAGTLPPSGGMDSQCNPLTGSCYCKRNVHGENCDICIPGTFGLNENDELGCKPCLCDVGGSYSAECNQLIGQCPCRPNLGGLQCNQVMDNFFVPPISKIVQPGNEGISEISTSVVDVPLDAALSTEMIIVKPIRVPMAHYTIDPNSYFHKTSSPTGTGNSTAPIIGGGSGGPDYDPPTDPRHPYQSYVWTSDGFMNVTEGSYLNFQINKIPKSMQYQFFLRYQPKTFVWKHIQVTISRPDESGRNPESPCYNTKPDEDHWPASLPLSKSSAIVEQQLGGSANLPCLESDEDKGSTEPYKVTIYFGDANDNEHDAKQWMLVDSLIVRPYYEQFPIFDVETVTKAEEFKLNFQNEQCLLKELDAANGLIKLSPMCEKMTYTIGAWLHDGAKSCDCNKQGSLSTECNPRGGQCQCRPGVTGRKCDQCKLGFFGFSSKGCTQCECDQQGTINADQICDQADGGKCRCREGVGGRDCSQCLPGYWGFPDCQKCECNGHATTCDERTGACFDCNHNTKGDHCDECADGYYGNAKLQALYGGVQAHGELDHPCSPCPCPNGPGSGRQFASSCHQAPLIGSRVDGLVGTSTLICECNEGYTGEHCDTCAPGYFGNPHQIGGSCNACECNGRIDTTDPDACDATTGECLKCKFNRASPDCLECADGYYEDNGECVPCNCDINGSSGDICDKRTGQCPCLNHIEGRTCNHCKFNFYDLANAGETGGCKACACNPSNSLNSDSACDEISGQCECKPEFGGRDCSTCKNGHWGNAELGDCKSCNCDVRGTIPGENTCDPFSGQCNCYEGVDGLQCDQCARGWKGQVPHCEQCGECFDSWDIIIQDLITKTTEVLDQVNNIQEKGVAGAYDTQFDKIEEYLRQAKSILNSDEGMNMLKERMEGIESKNQDGTTRLSDIYTSFDEIESKNDDQLDKLRSMKNAIENYEQDLDHLKRQLTQIENKDPIIMWQRIEEMVSNATKFEHFAKHAVGFDDNPDDNLLTQSAQIRAQVEQAIPEREVDFIKASKELGEMIDDSEDIVQLKIGDINELVCGAATEECDPACGGALCKLDGQSHCGTPNYNLISGGEQTCQSSAYKMADDALKHVNAAEESLRSIKQEVDAALDETEPIRTKAQDAHDKAADVNRQAEDVSKQIREYHEKIITLVNEISDFLNADVHAKPENILKIAKEVLSIDLPDQSQIDQLKRQMAELGMGTPSDDDGESTGPTLQEITGVEQEASDVLEKARALSEKVTKAIQNYKDAESNCADATDKNTKANNDATLAEKENQEIISNIKNLQELMEKLKNLVSDDGGVKTQVEDINRRITAAKLNNESANAAAKEADGIYDGVKADWDEFKVTDDYQAGIDFTEKVNDLRHEQDKAFKLKDDVQKLIAEVNSYRKEWELLEDQHKKIRLKVDNEKKELETIKKNAEKVREEIHAKLFVNEACPTPGR